MIMEDDNNDISVEVEIPSYLYDTDYDDVCQMKMTKNLIHFVIEPEILKYGN